MYFKNQRDHYGLISILFHWLTVVFVAVLIPLGLWMVELDYYDAWYKKGPDLHRSLGILLGAVLIFRSAWRLGNPRPALPAYIPTWQQRTALSVQALMYILLYTLVISGYLISTADERSISVFNWFEISALRLDIENQEDIAGEFHYWLAMSLLVTLTLHISGAMRHVLHGNGNILMRMIKPESR